MEPTFKPLPHQQIAKDFILSHPYCALFLKMGLGKTGTVLDVMDDLNPNHHVLVIAPKNIARSTWIDEIEKWHFPFRWKSLIVNERGNKLSKKKRLELYKSIPNEPPTIWFINRDLICDLIANMPTFYDPILQRTAPYWYFPTVIIDELQSFKSYDSNRFKAMQTVRPYISRLIGLTGTPQPNSIEDLWAEIWLLDMGQRLGPNITAFRRNFEFAAKIYNGHQAQWTPLPGAEAYIHQVISDLVISMENSSMPIPDITYNTIKVHLEPEEMELYKRMKEDLVLSLDDDTEVVAVNRGVLHSKLSQMASGALYKAKGSKEFYKIHERKLEMCEYIINNSNDNVIIAYHFKSDLMMLKDYLMHKGIHAEAFNGKPEMIRRWNNKQIPVLLIQPASAGHGLNLQDGGHTLIWYTIPDSLEQYQQCNARLHRQGQKDPVTVFILLAQGTIDSRLLWNIDTKDESQQNLYDATSVANNPNIGRSQFLTAYNATRDELMDTDAYRNNNRIKARVDMAFPQLTTSKEIDDTQAEFIESQKDFDPDRLNAKPSNRKPRQKIDDDDNDEPSPMIFPTANSSN